MAKPDTKFIFFKDWAVLIDSLNTDDRLYFWDLFSKCDLNSVCERDAVKPIWNFIVSQAIKMNEKYTENIINRNIQNGKKGGRPKTQPNPNNPVGFTEPNQTQITLKRKESKIIESKIIEDKNKSVPAFELFLSYALENKPKASEQDLELKYKAWVQNNWKDGNNKPIKNWKSKLLSTLPYIKEVEQKGKLHFNSPII